MIETRRLKNVVTCMQTIFEIYFSHHRYNIWNENNTFTEGKIDSAGNKTIY